jgi:hypothetical protein
MARLLSHRICIGFLFVAQLAAINADEGNSTVIADDSTPSEVGLQFFHNEMRHGKYNELLGATRNNQKTIACMGRLL